MSQLGSTGIRPVWIASYPRSGNTFLRIVFQNIFKLPTYSVYRVEGQNLYDPSAESLEQAPFLPRDWRSLKSEAADATLTLIKTHDLPEDSAEAIYIIRDGRPTIESYYHYHKKFAFEQPSLTEIIAGACQFGSWSSHYQGWKPRSRTRTLLLRYEELVSKPQGVISAIAGFLKLTPLGSRLPSFDELKERFPAFFRRGQNQDYLSQWSPGQMALFNQLQGQTMRELGYTLTDAGEVPRDIVLELAHSAARLHQLYLQQLNNQGGFHPALQALTEKVAKISAELSTVQRNKWVRAGVRLGAVAPPGSDHGVAAT